MPDRPATVADLVQIARVMRRVARMLDSVPTDEIARPAPIDATEAGDTDAQQDTLQ